MSRVWIILMLLLACLHCHLLDCPPFCLCTGPSVLNCSLAGLWVLPQTPHSVAHLDVSHNRLERVMLQRRTLPQLRSLRLANNSIARLSLCIHGRVQGRGCASWAPNLQLLSVERNQLRRLPRGLSALEALEVLHMSFNSIATIQLGELDNLRGLRELHLQHNLINNLHPHVFRHLHQLKILDVSFNMLTSLHPSIYLSLHIIGADVHLTGNRWRCDCSMHSIRRWMALDRSRDSHSWELVCTSPPNLAGADVLHLEDADLNCWSAEKEPKLHHDVTVHRGSQVPLSCATKGALWWTPAGLVPANQPHSGLLVSALTEKNTGLYVCLSKDHQVVSVFHLHIARTSRKVRSVPERIAGGERSQSVTQSNLTLAVCLSVLITFLVAFILGVLLRPCIDILWKRITRKKTSDSVSSAEERQYDNEAYSEGEDPEELRPHRERRVTFSTVDFSEENNVKYYNTERETKANSTVVECEMVADGDSGSEKHLERRRSEDTRGFSDRNLKRSGSLSDSSLSDKDRKEVDTVQHNSTELPQISINNISGFSSEPIPNWITHPNNGQMLAAEPEVDEEQFDFSDSVRSTSPRASSRMGSFNYTRQIMPRLNRKDSSSSSSYMSEDEPSQYTVNPDPQVEEEVRRSYVKTNVSDTLASLKASSGYEPTLDQDTELWWPAVDLEQSMRVQRRLDIKMCDADGQTTSFREKPGTGIVVTAGVAASTYFSSSDSKEDETRYAVTVSQTLDSQTQWPALDLEHTISVQRRLDIKAPSLTSDSSSGTDSLDGSIRFAEAPQKVDRAGPQNQEVRQETDTRWPTIDLHQIPHIERYLNVKSTLPDSSWSNDSEDRTRASMVQPPSKVSPSYDPQATWPSIDLKDSFRIKRRLDVKPLSPTSGSTSSIDNKNETMYYTQKQEQGTIEVTRNPTKASPTPSYDPQTPWPPVNLDDSIRIKRRLDVKAPSPTLNALSNSDSDDEMNNHVRKVEQGTKQVTRQPIKAHPTRSPWPSIDLEDSFRIKRHLNVKAPPPPSDSSSSSDSEHETTHYITEKEQGATKVTMNPTKASPTPSYDPQTPWPPVNLDDSIRIKRRLDVKAPSPTLNALSNSDSDDEMNNHVRKVEQGTKQVTRQPIKAHPTRSPWPSIDLEDSFRIKRHLNVKATPPPSDSSSSSDSEHETTHYITEKEQGATKVTRNPTKASPTPSYDPQTPWPPVNLDDSIRIKRRLDVKAPSPTLNALSNSDSDDEMNNHVTKVEQGTKQVTRHPIKAHPTRSPWPSIDLEYSFRIKRRLNVKAPPPPSDSSSSSDSEHEIIHHITKHEQGATKVTRYSSEESPTPNYDPHAPWPSVNFEDSFRIKRLDVKATSSTLDESSDSDDERTNHITKLEQGTINVTRYPIKAPSTQSYYPHSPWPSIDLENGFRIKKRLNVKAPPPPSDSSSSSENEHETTHHIIREQRAKYRTETSPTPTCDPQAPWPSVNLENAFRVNRRLDVKLLTSNTSSNSDSDDEMTNHITKHEQGTTKVTRYPIKVSPTSSYDPQTFWPSINLENSFRIRRRLNIKAPSPISGSSSSSDSEHETIHHVTKQEQGATKVTKYSSKESQTPKYDPHAPWPSIDLEDSFRIKRHLNVKVPSPTSDSSSSNNSEDETRSHTQKHEKGTRIVTRLPTKASPRPSHDPQAPWHSINLEDSFRIKRRLDIKTLSSTSNSSSSSDSEHEAIYQPTKQEHEITKLTKYPIKTPPTSSYQASWPSVDLDGTFRIKRHLNVKALSPNSDSPSSSDTEDETMYSTKKNEQGSIEVTRYPIKPPPTLNYDPQSRWPSIDLEDSFRIKRRLHVKPLSPPSDSPCSSNSEHKMTQKQGVQNIIRYPIKVPPIQSYDPEVPWPSLDFKDSFQIKRHLDFKASSTTSDLSSSSEREDKTMYYSPKQELGATKITSYPNTTLLSPMYGPQSLWPSLDLENSFQIKRRLNINAPSPPSDSLSSSDHEYEITHHIIKQELGTRNALHPIKVSPRPSSNRQSSWPSLDLEDSFRIKRRLDFQVLSPTSDLSSSSIKQEQGTANIARYPITELPKPVHDLQGIWSSLELEDSFRRRLESKAPSPALTSSNDSEEDTIVDVQRQGYYELHKGRSPTEPSNHHALETERPTVDFHRLKRLDFNTLSPASSTIGDETNQYNGSLQHGLDDDSDGKTVLKGTSVTLHTKSQDQETNLRYNPRLKRRLDIKAPLQTPVRISSSDSMVASSHVESTRGTSWPVVDLGSDTRVRWRLDIKTAPADVADGGRQDHTVGGNQPRSSNEQDDSNVEGAPQRTKRDSNIKFEKYVTVPETTGDETRNTTTEINPELQSRWANMHLGVSRFRKRLEIISHAREPPMVPLSESDPGATKQKLTVVGWQRIKHTESPLTATQVHNNADKPALGPTSEGKLSLPGVPHIKRYLDAKAPATLQHLDSSSSSENESTEHSQWGRKSHDLNLSSPYATQRLETQQTTEKSQIATVPRQSSSNNSKDETNEVAEANEMTEVARSVTTDTESPIQYRRLIIKASSLPNDTSPREQHTDVMTTLHGSSYSTRYQLPSLAPKTIPNPRSADISSTRDKHGSSDIVRYQNPSLAPKTTPDQGSEDDTPTMDSSGVNIVTTQDGSSYSARYPLPYTARYQNPYVAPKTTPSPGSMDDTTPKRDSSSVNIMTTQSGSSYSARYQIPSLAPRPFRSSTEGPPAEIRWKGLRTRLSDLSKHPDSSLPSPLEGLQKTVDGSFTQEIAQEKGSTTVTRSLKLSSGSLSSFSTDEMWKSTPEKREKRGLGALKAMSSERQTWDKEDEKVNSFQPSGASGNLNQNRSEVHVSYTSASIAEDVPHDILRYRTHALLTKEIPPPVPTTPLPDEAMELTWNSKSSYNPSMSQV